MSDMKLQLILEAQNRTDKALQDLQKELGKIEKAGLSLKKLFAVGGGLFGGLALKSLASDMLDITRQFQGLEASLVTVTGSERAATQAFARLQQFATETPYQLTEVVEAFTKLKALGLDPSTAAMRSYGNTASAMGKSLDQMIEAVADAATGEFERLKEFGIKARQNGDTVRFTFRGVTTEVKNSAKEIEAYLRRIGEVEFAGGMDRQMETLGGALSNLEDNWDNLLTAFGNLLPIREAVEALSTLTAQIRELVAPTLRGQIADLDQQIRFVGEQMNEAEEIAMYSGGSANLSGLEKQMAELEKRRAKLQAELDKLMKSPKEKSHGRGGDTRGGSVDPVKQKSLAGQNFYGDGIWEKQARERIAREKKVLDALYEMNKERFKDIAAVGIAEGRKTAKDSWRAKDEELEQVKDRAKSAKLEIDALLKDTDGALTELTQFGVQAARNIQDAFADFLFNPFEDGLNGMLKGFGDTVRKMLSQVAANQILSGLFGGLAGSSNSFLSFIGKSFSTPVHHDGGTFTPKFHVGGLNNNEGFAILERGERVLSRDQNRTFDKLAALLDGAGGSGGTRVTIVNQGEPVQVAAVSQSRGSDGTRELVIQLEKKLAGRLSAQGGALAGALERTYGLSRTGR